MREQQSDLDDSVIAQVLECGLVARYGRDLEGLNWARDQIRKELQEKFWALPPYTYSSDK